MMSNLKDNQDFVFCQEHNHMIHKENAKHLMQAANQREQEQEDVINQLDTMISFSVGSNAPSYLPRKNINQNLKQAGYTEKPRPKNHNILPNMTEMFLKFMGYETR